jgi:DNA-binding NarL/FixJ family response regulator
MLARAAGLEFSMVIRLLFATTDLATRELFASLLASALELTPLQISVAHATSLDELLARVDARADDVVILDWPIANESTPAVVRTMTLRNPSVRTVTLLPLSHRAYRREVWQAGACSSIAKEHIEQEWLSSILCVMNRAMEREARLLAAFEAGMPAPAVEPTVCCGNVAA